MLKLYLDGHPVLENERNLRRRGVSFFISFVAHAGIFLGLILFYEPLKVHLYQDVRNVIITSPDEIFFPEYSEPAALAAPSSDEAPEKREQRPAGSKAAVLEAATEEIPSQARSAEERESEFSSQFQLRQPQSERLRLSSGYEMELSLQEEPCIPFSSQTRDKETESETDVSNFVGSDLSDGQLSTYSGSRGPGGRSWLQAQLDQLNEEADLSPWAAEVVAIVLGNWTVPPSGQYTLIGRVEIAAFIQKDGTVSRSEIRISSQNFLIDETALKAVEASSLPGLPEDYPKDMVQIKLVFALQ